MTASHWQALAQQALLAFGHPQARATFIQHSENITFHIVQPNGQEALLRLHQPLTAEFGNHGADPQQVRSETAWLLALNEANIPAPRPLATPEGETVIALPGEGRPILATLLSWLPGDVLPSSPNASQAQALGELVGRVHAHGRSWQPPPNFHRPRWDLPRFHHALQTLSIMQADGRMTHQDIYPLQRTLNLLADVIQQHQPEQGLLHGDLYLGNVIWQGDQPQLIDFSMCGPGYYLYDLAACLEHIPYHLQAFFIDAYRRYHPLSDEHLQLLPGFYIAHALVSLSIWVNHGPAQETLIHRLGIVRRAAREFIHSY